MPLSKARNRERMRILRHSSVQPATSLGKSTHSELQAMIHNIERGNTSQRATYVQPNTDVIPWYNPEIHTTGDKVKQFRNGHVEVMTL